MVDVIERAEQLDLGPLSVNAFGEKFFFNINRGSFDKVGAEAIFDRYFGDELLGDDALHIIIGTDSGLLPHYIQRKPLPKGTRYIFVEPEHVLRALTENKLLADLDDRIVCVSLEQWQEAISNFKINDYLYINSVRSHNAICAQDDHINEYAELSWHIAEVLSQLHWQISVELGSEAFITRQINNVADNLRPAKLLENAFTEKTVMILAGGPSLDEVLPWLSSNRSRIVMFAVSRISRQLIQHGIEPDFVFSVDPTELSFDISKEMLEFSSKPIFVYSYHTVPTLVSQWRGISLYLGARLPWPSRLNVNNISSVGPTVTNTALAVAYHFGFKRIFLAGVDLCFTREGFTHATGSDEQLAGPRFNLTSLQIETNAGFMAPTSCDFAQAVASLGMQAKVLTAKGCQIFNISGNAAKVENIDFLPLSQIDIPDSELDVAEVAASRIGVDFNNGDYYLSILDDLRRAQYQIGAISKMAENARQTNEEMYSAQGIIENYKDKKKLDQIEKKFKREHRHYSKLVKSFGIRSFIKLTKPFNDEDWSAEEAKHLGNVFYDAYLEGASKLMRLLDDAVDRVQARQQECLMEPNFDLLINQTTRDGSFGRVRLWRGLERAGRIRIPPELESRLDEIECRYSENVGEKNTRHFAKAKRQGDLGSLKQRAALLFKHKKVNELADLLTSLDKHLDPKAVEPYRLLVAGYLAELRGQLTEALESYQGIIDAGDALLEQALTRIADIGIESNDIKSSSLALQCLAQVSPLYLPLYAEIQRLHGDILTAIDAYSTYIGQFPHDTLTQIKLATLYAEQEIYDAADMMLDFILADKPTLEAAVAMKSAIRKAKLQSGAKE